jgi:hypothetical protein
VLFLKLNIMKNKQIIKDDKKNPVRDCMLVEMYKSSDCSTPYGVGGDVWTFFLSTFES